MNLIHQSIWNSQTGTVVAVPENTRSAGKRRSSRHSAGGDSPGFRLAILTAALLMAGGASVQAQPTGGVVSAGAAAIGGTPGNMTITQMTPNVAINWQSFGVLAGQSVQFVQPSGNAVALNRVTGGEPSGIFGSLSSNGKVFLVNPNGILFGQGASVNVGGLVASTLAITDANFMAGNYKFSEAGTGTVVNQGTINAASGSYVALLGASVSNQGTISARLGTVALAAGQAITLDMAGDRLLNVTVDQGAVNALVENGGVIRADGGQVLMTTQAAGSLLSNAVNNTGLVQAQTVENINGTIKLLSGMHNGTMTVDGTLDASAPQGGNGGFIETSAANVRIENNARIDTSAATGSTGHWLIDPQDFIVGSGATDNISGVKLSGLLVTNNVTISTNTGPDADIAGTPPLSNLNTATPGNGDIHINEVVAWTGSSNPTTLTLNAARDVNINAPITATNGNLAACCGRDINVRAAITTVNGSVLLSGGRDVNLAAALSTTDGNIAMCAARDVVISAKLTLTRGSSIAGQSLGLPQGLLLNAGYGGNGPGAAGGTLVFAPSTPAMTVTGPNAPVTVNYNPVSYTTPTDYSSRFILTGGAAVTQHMLVFAGGGDKSFDGTTATTLSTLQGNPAGVSLIAGPGSMAHFDNADVGTGKVVTFSGYSLGGADAARYALATSCCAPVVNRTTGTITAVTGSVVPPVDVAGLPGVVGASGVFGVTGVAGVTGGQFIAPVSGAVGPAAVNSPLANRQARSFTQLPVAPIYPGDTGAVALNVLPSDMPAVALHVTAPPSTEVAPVAPVQVRPAPYVAPVYQPRQDRH